MAKNQVTKATKAEVEEVKGELPFDMSADMGAGMEGADSESFAIPFLVVLQKMSPQCDEGQPGYLEDAKPGMLFNTVTGELYDGKEGVLFLPCAFQRRYILWGPRGSGNSFMGEYMPSDVEEMKRDGRLKEVEGRLYAPDERGEVNEKRSPRMVDTRSHFGLVVDGSNVTPVVMPLRSTQIKKSKQLMSMLSGAKINGKTPPTWANQIRITTVAEANDEGSWHGVRFQPEGFIQSRELYDAGRDFYKAITKGEVKVDYAKSDGEETSPDSDAGGF